LIDTTARPEILDPGHIARIARREILDAGRIT
jgi:hypothetical protein